MCLPQLATARGRINCYGRKYVCPTLQRQGEGLPPVTAGNMSTPPCNGKEKDSHLSRQGVCRPHLATARRRIHGTEYVCPTTAAPPCNGKENAGNITAPPCNGKEKGCHLSRQGICLLHLATARGRIVTCHGREYICPSLQRQGEG
jgi:hypothetical protein